MIGSFMKLRTWISTLLIALFGLIAVHVYLSWQVRDLSAISGRVEILMAAEEESQGSLDTLDILEEARKAKREQTKLTVSERDVNVYLAQKLVGEQIGPLGSVAQIKGVWVDFQPDQIEVIIERRIDVSEVAETVQGEKTNSSSIKPFDHTVSIVLKVVSEKTAKGQRIETLIKSATFGQSPAPGFYARLVEHGFTQILQALAEEREACYEEMAEIHVTEGAIEFNPIRDTVIVKAQ